MSDTRDRNIFSEDDEHAGGEVNPGVGIGLTGTAGSGSETRGFTGEPADDIGSDIYSDLGAAAGDDERMLRGESADGNDTEPPSGGHRSDPSRPPMPRDRR
jgi:hypothetical protein